MMNSVELQKQPRSRYYYHNTMLFDTERMSVEPAEDSMAMAAMPGDIIEELTIA